MPRSGLAAGSASPRSPIVEATGTMSRLYQRSYPVVDTVALACIVGAWILIQFFATPFHRMFSLDNRSIQFPYALVERVPVVWNVIYAGVIPFLILVAWAAVFRPYPHKVQVTLLGFLIALMLTSLITDIIKNAVGRPRPDLISRCIPRKGTPEDSLVSWTVCTQPNEHILQEGWRSFPSGHSSFSFSGLGYLSLFLSGQMHVFRPRTDLCRCLVAFVPFLCALLIAISRLDDYRHDVYDVTCGSLLGLLVAYFSYRRYYPALRSITCESPYGRDETIGPDGFSKLPGDEEQQLPGHVSATRLWDARESYQLAEAAASQER
ncbi:acid phosphatase/Vanadium-dependent haloperoxidase [Aspergillus sclerotioniger CBS 115572]|uniref:Acid phosphatase/Vanadium-dependent haloperoxidase n=1 Tax=Aspergillus sclerotioniger CBS 115572 TaxID=1450535 RepID=A0A317WF90_9EURO|nr:acid phosphatase/Vanadium-dependent haloperoxidase [Aspergillus sclerotioniger CBS 115572]PWY83668.1 acid phosphatase/Vanadium-dependent haloperoxidase [Aspergillus sclerotioniger CBS 115572]